MMRKSIRCDLITWGEVSRLARRVASSIRASGFAPDIVIGIARGGWVPARLLCDQLDLYDLVSIRITHYQSGAQKTREAKISAPLAVEIRHLDVLLVDDVSDTGDTLRLALDHIRAFEPRSVKVAVLHHKEVSPVIPDFYGRKVVAWRWLIYPWAVMEDLSGFLRAMDPIPVSLEQAIERLRADHGLELPRPFAAEVLAALLQRRDVPTAGD